MSTLDREFSIASDFSNTPGPRYRDEGDYTGEELRQDHLLPLIKQAAEDEKTITINIDGTHGYLTSFLEEVFGGLIRDDGFSKDQLDTILKIVSEEEPYLLDDIKEYMEDAERESK